MPTFQVVLSEPKTRKAVKLELKDPKSSFMIGLKLGQVVDANPIGIKGKIKITGGSDRAGFPMRSGIQGIGKKYVNIADSPGFKSTTSGLRRRKLLRGETISDDIYQINAVLTEGEMPEAPAEAKSEAEAGPKAGKKA
jgi:small subunit ribosomal protein S6e